MEHILRCHDIVKTDLVRAENCALYDAQGKRYVDLESGIWCTVIGHCHPRINQVIHTQIELVMHLGTRYPSCLAEETAVAVLDLVGMSDGKCVFLSSGSEAVEFAVQSAKGVTQRTLLFTLAGSYLAAYGSAGKQLAAEWRVFDWGACRDADSRQCLRDVPFEAIGAFVFEPGGSGSALVRFPPEALVREIAHRVREAGGLLVVNEVTTGMGRTGKWFGFQHYGIKPDIVALGKGLGNGYPVSAVAMRRDIAEKLEEGGFRYAQSHQNDPLGCRVAQEVIAVLREGDWIERGNAVGEMFLQGLRRIQERHPVVKDARGRGMLLAVEFRPDERLSATTVCNALREKGFLVGCYPTGNVLRFSPALTIEEADIVAFLESLEAILEASA